MLCVSKSMVEGRRPECCVSKSKVEGRRPECCVFQNQKLRAEGSSVVCFRIKSRGPKARVLFVSESKVEGRRPECRAFQNQR